MKVNLKRVPNFIRAASPSGLRRLCLKRNMQDNIEHRYDIVYDGKYWFAWFLDEVQLKAEEVKGKLTLKIDDKKEEKIEGLDG